MRMPPSSAREIRTILLPYLKSTGGSFFLLTASHARDAQVGRCLMPTSIDTLSPASPGRGGSKLGRCPFCSSGVGDSVSGWLKNSSSALGEVTITAICFFLLLGG